MHINWDTVAAVLIGMVILILFLRCLVLLHLWVWKHDKHWPWHKDQTLLDHISEYNVLRAHRIGRLRLTDEERLEIEHLRRALAYHHDQRMKQQPGSGTTGFTPGVNS